MLAERLASIREQVGRAARTAGRDPGAIRLLAVTKGHPAGSIEAALSLGLRDIGESRVQEAEAKRAAIAARGVSWHMIGHLQRNKARMAASLFDTVHSWTAPPWPVIGPAPWPDAPRLRVFVEVELTGLPGAPGWRPPRRELCSTPCATSRRSSSWG